jgi:predicted nucleotidyltransferase
MNAKNIKESVADLKRILSEYFGTDIEIYIFGSVARNDYRADSDIDILVLLPGKVNTAREEEVIDLAYEVELKHNVVFGIVVYSKEFWSSMKAQVMPFHQNVQKEAVRI